ETGRAAGDLQLGDFREHIQQLLGESIREVLVLLVPTHVHERKDRDRRRSAPTLRLGRLQLLLHTAELASELASRLETPGGVLLQTAIDNRSEFPGKV